MSDQAMKDREAQVEDDESVGQRDADPQVSVKPDGEVEVRPSKQEERARKWNERVGSAVEERTRPLMDRIEHMNRTIEGLNESLARMRPQQEEGRKREGGVDPEFMKLRRRQGEIAATMNRISAGQERRSQSEIDALENEYYELDQKALDLRAAALADQRLEKFQRESPRPNPEVTVIQSEFPDVIANPKAAAWAAAAFQQMVVEADGQPFDRLAGHRKALTAAAERFGIRRTSLPGPKPHEQARFGGAPPASGPGSSRGGGGRLTKEQREIAQARYKDLPPAEAERRWSEAMLRRDPHFFG